jgi:hypothetical protein
MYSGSAPSSMTKRRTVSSIDEAHIRVSMNGREYEDITPVEVRTLTRYLHDNTPSRAA